MSRRDRHDLGDPTTGLSVEDGGQGDGTGSPTVTFSGGSVSFPYFPSLVSSSGCLLP